MSAFKIKRSSAGNYQTSLRGRSGRIFQFEEGDYKGMWMVDWGATGYEYSDPVWTYREAKQIAENWNFEKENESCH